MKTSKQYTPSFYTILIMWAGIMLVNHFYGMYEGDWFMNGWLSCFLVLVIDWCWFIWTIEDNEKEFEAKP
jgi:hypothetical protein